MFHSSESVDRHRRIHFTLCRSRGGQLGGNPRHIAAVPCAAQVPSPHAAMGGGHRCSDIILTIAQRLPCTLHLESARAIAKRMLDERVHPVHLEFPGLGLDDLKTVVESWWCALFRVFPFSSLPSRVTQWCFFGRMPSSAGDVPITRTSTLPSDDLIEKSVSCLRHKRPTHGSGCCRARAFFFFCTDDSGKATLSIFFAKDSSRCVTQVPSLYVSIQSHNGVFVGGRPVVGSSRCGIEPLFLKRRHGDSQRVIMTRGLFYSTRCLIFR